ncbi:hypothetical protein ACFMQL_32120 [Nonomuraea fastidiosa]|uniref:hypothetical protein n=1 Tax=Nonomuraea fastidiosa TaxID=46173 RepID=UPI00366EEC30
MSQPLEVACDESGAEGEKLVGGNSSVFAHASVLMDRDTAAACVAELRERAPTPATEYRAGHVLRDKHRAALLWLLGPGGPVLGHVRVFLTDKTFYIVGKVAGLLQDDHTPRIGLDPRARAAAVTLYREGPRAFGPGLWAAFLDSFNYLLRAKNGHGITISVADAYLLVQEMRAAGGPAGEVMRALWRARDRVEEFRERLLADPYVFPALDPLIPAIAAAVTSWGDGRGPVVVVHDRQTTLTDERIDQMRRILGGRMAGLRLINSELDERLQVADVLAGVARRAAAHELDGRPDRELTELLRPYVDPASIWAGEHGPFA